MWKFQRIRLLLERVSSENAELMYRQRTERQQQVNSDVLEGKTSFTHEVQDRLEVVLIIINELMYRSCRAHQTLRAVCPRKDAPQVQWCSIRNTWQTSLTFYNRI